MTLIVSARTMDGIVIAGDSLATVLMPGSDVQGEMATSCPECKHEFNAPYSATSPWTPSTTRSYAQKVFSFLDTFGIGLYNNLNIGDKTIHFLILQLEKMVNDTRLGRPGTAKEAAELIGGFLQQRLLSSYALLQLDIKENSDDWCHSGIQVVGYDEEEATTYDVRIAKKLKISPYNGLDVLVTGQIDVFNAILSMYELDNMNHPNFATFSLQDAIRYAEFLIQTTASMQHFSRKFPNVGGSVDVALVTPFDKFRWIKQKPLFEASGDSTGR